MRITLRDERADEDETAEETYEYDGGIREFVEYLNETRSAMHEEVIYFEDEDQNIQVEVAMQATEELQGRSTPSRTTSTPARAVPTSPASRPH